ncbi:MAG: hypothetical protein M3Q10_09755, partial [Chloroflexota bacterium]|nr:hypothetical protein [Chloroflexota bacterium]
LRLLATPAAALVATSAVVAGKSSADPAAVRAAARALSFSGEVLVEPDPAAAFDAALDLARTRGAPVLATGSLYLVGAVRERWYPNAAIVREQTPWPAGKTASGPGAP